jgi:membrane associated rhomboid family serine protease
METNQILFLIAVLNLGGDLFNIIRFRHHIPRWILPANIISLTICGIGWLFFKTQVGMISVATLAIYVALIKLRARPNKRLKIGPGPCTKLLIALNLCGYGYQLYVGATDDPIMMVSIGALFSPLIEQGQWWRVLTAQFLHWGVVHLALNMLGLWFLGPMVERALGATRFVFAYLFSGAAGMTIAWLLATYGPEPRAIILLGASASVLGLVGLQIAIARKAYKISGSPAAKAQASAMVQIIALQIVFDLMVPEVSSTAHLGGAVVGWGLGMVLSSLLLARADNPKNGSYGPENGASTRNHFGF